MDCLLGHIRMAAVERWSLVEVQLYIIKLSEKQKEDKSTEITKGPMNPFTSKI